MITPSMKWAARNVVRCSNRNVIFHRSLLIRVAGTEYSFHSEWTYRIHYYVSSLHYWLLSVHTTYSTLDTVFVPSSEHALFYVEYCFFRCVIMGWKIAFYYPEVKMMNRCGRGIRCRFHRAIFLTRAVSFC